MPTVAEFATAIKGNQGQLNPSSAQPIGVTAQRSAESPGGDDRSHLARFLPTSATPPAGVFHVSTTKG